MIKRTLYFGNPAYLSLKNAQLVVKIPNAEGDDTVRTIPIEDIGFVILDNPQITITHGTLGALVENNTAVVTCDSRHMPAGLLLPTEGNTTQSERYRNQIEASLPLRKQIWQQTIQAKIRNQAAALEKRRGKNSAICSRGQTMCAAATAKTLKHVQQYSTGTTCLPPSSTSSAATPTATCQIACSTTATPYLGRL